MLEQVRNLGLKRRTVRATSREGVAEFYTRLAPIDGDFDPYVSPVFGVTEDESLKEAIAFELDARKYASELNEFYE